MKLTRLTVVAVAGAAVVLAASISPAMSSPAPTATTAGAVTSAAAKPPKSQKVSVLYALTAARGTLTAVEGKKRHYVLTLRAASDHVTWFTDRPARQSGFLPTAGYASSWAGYGFDTDPPNVALVVREPSGATDTVVAVMTRPTVTATGVFTARLRVLSKDQAQAIGSHLASHAGRHDTKVPARFTAAALFIDDDTATYVGTSPTGCLIKPYAVCRFAKLSGADLSGASLVGADLDGADLSGADLSGAYLGYAMLYSINLSGADLTRAVLTASDLRKANLAGADLTRANLTGALLASAYSDSTTTCPSGSPGPCW